MAPFEPTPRSRRTELGRAGARQDHLAIDGDRAPQEVPTIERESEALALAESGAGGNGHERPVATRHLGNDRLDLIDGRWDDGGLRLPGEPDVLGRVVDDETVPDRIAEDRGEDPEDGLDRCGCEHLGAPPNPGLHLARADRGERTVTERDAASRWIDVGAVEDLALDASQESLGVGLTVEVLRPLGPTRMDSVARPPLAARSLVDACHPASLRPRTRRVRSG